jgi:hypothetical protein
LREWRPQPVPPDRGLSQLLGKCVERRDRAYGSRRTVRRSACASRSASVHVRVGTSAFRKLKNLYTRIVPIFEDFGFTPPSAGVIARAFSEKIEKAIIQHCESFHSQRETPPRREHAPRRDATWLSRSVATLRPRNLFNSSRWFEMLSRASRSVGGIRIAVRFASVKRMSTRARRSAL